MKTLRLPFNPWPLGIVAAFAVFIAGTFTLIVVATSSRSDLVTADYYEQEIRYQSRIDERGRTRPWESKIAVAFDATECAIRIGLPREHAALGATGRIELYRPASAGQDREVQLALDSAGRQTIAATSLRPGLWRVRLHWKAGGEEFFADRSLEIPPLKSS